MTNSWAVFNGKAVRQMAQDERLQIVDIKRNRKQDVETRWQAARLLNRFKKGESIPQLSYRERVQSKAIERLVRARLIELEGPKVIEMPPPRRLEKAA